MNLNIYFLRHGQTASSRGNLFCGSIDPGLTTDGEEMAAVFATAYANTPWEAIYCSPKERAILTAEPLAHKLNMELQLRDGLQEINYGAWEGKDVATVDREYHDVSHKATIRILLCSLLGIDAGRFRYRLGMPVGSVSIVEFGQYGPLLKVLADRSHLTDRLRALPGT